MSRTVRKSSSALLVEGAKDARIFRNLVEESACDVVQAEGKRNAIGALGILRRSSQAGILAVVDSDFSRLDDQLILDPDVLQTDGHDLEAMLLKSSAPEKVMIELDLKPDAFGKELGLLLATSMMPLGYARLASTKQGLNLGFKHLDYSQFVVGPPPEIDQDKLCREIVTKNPHFRHRSKDLVAHMNRLASSNHDCWQVSCGHDMTAALAIMLTRKFGRDVLPFTVERQLRLSFHFTDFEKTILHRQILEWEQRNRNQQILKRRKPH